MINKKKHIIILLVIVLQILFINGCNSENQEEENIYKHYDPTISLDYREFKEELVIAKKFNPELTQLDYMFLNKDGEISLNNKQSNSINFIDENMNAIYFYHGGEIEDWKIRGTSGNGDKLYEFDIVDALSKEVIADLEIGYNSISDIRIFSLEKGNVGIALDCIEYIKVVVINPFSQKMKKYEKYEDIFGKTNRFTLKTVTQNQTLFFDSENNEIVFFDNDKGEIEFAVSAPEDENTESQGFSSPCIVEHQGYWYVYNSTGIYRSKTEKTNWELLISASKTENISKNTGCRDILVQSENEIYIYLIKDGNFDGTEATYCIVKFELE